MLHFKLKDKVSLRINDQLNRDLHQNCMQAVTFMILMYIQINVCKCPLIYRTLICVFCVSCLYTVGVLPRKLVSHHSVFCLKREM